MESNEEKKRANVSKGEYGESEQNQIVGGNVSPTNEKNRQYLDEDALSNDQLEEIVGGLTYVKIPLCKACKERIAVHGMSLCASCYK